ncbi:MAG: hypothetical protein BZY88_19000 [SAR202 cluster bacterium Io17-Chloro-G9]|nr:MAG: hypothetical protein BZY88_19000 [SAR202 cluster bacterium Io17-Chloro-G9]
MFRDIASKPNYNWWVLWAVAAGFFLSVIDHGTVIVALPEIEAHFGADLPTVKWVIIGYFLSISVLLLPMGRLGDMIGRRRVFILGFSIFVLASALAGASRWLDLPTLITAKAIQGIGSAMIQGNGMAIIISVFPGGERGKALGYHLTVVGVGAIVGPAFGGLLISIWGWPSIFFVNIPLGLFIVVLSLMILRDEPLSTGAVPGQRPSFDWPGALFSGAALLAFLLAVGNGDRVGWASAPILTGAGASVALLAVFIWWELRTESPMLDLRLFGRKLFSLGVAAGWMMFLGSAGSRFLLPFYLQRLLELSPREVGLLMIAPALCIVAMGPISGRLSDRYGWRWLTVAGTALGAAAWFALAANLTESSPVVFIVLMLMVQSAGMGLFISPNISSIVSSVDRSSYGVVSSLTHLIRNSGDVTSIALATTAVVMVMGSRGVEPSLGTVSPLVAEAFVSGVRWAFAFLGSILVVAAAICLVRGERAKTELTTPRPAPSGLAVGDGSSSEPAA